MSFLRKACYRISRAAGWDIHRKSPELSVESYISEFWRPMGINCILDVGACLGHWASLIRDRGFDGHIISFEPVLPSFEVLRRRACKDRRWSVYPYALGSIAGQASINVWASSVFSSIRQPTARLPAASSTQEIQVLRLDDVFAEVTRHIVNPRAYLKIDTQGSDLDVFKGASGALSKIVVVQSELSLIPLYEETPRWDESIATFAQAGFEPSAFFTACRSEGFRLLELDGVFVRPDWQIASPPCIE